jgi:alpha-amylase
MSRRRVSVVLLAVALAAAAASTPVGTVGAAPSGPLVGKHSLRAPVTDETFYFVMADRFENGDTDNDRGGISGGVDQHGFGPTNKGFYQGGDLKGLLDRIDYIQDLGHHVDLAGSQFREQGRATRGRPVGGLPRLLGHRLHTDRPPPGHE